MTMMTRRRKMATMSMNKCTIQRMNNVHFKRLVVFLFHVAVRSRPGTCCHTRFPDKETRNQISKKQNHRIKTQARYPPSHAYITMDGPQLNVSEEYRKIAERLKKYMHSHSNIPFQFSIISHQQTLTLFLTFCTLYIYVCVCVYV